jgi:hypothetical protein
MGCEAEGTDAEFGSLLTSLESRLRTIQVTEGQNTDIRKFLAGCDVYNWAANYIPVVTTAIQL